MQNKDKRESLYEDIGLLMFMLMISALAVMLIISEAVVINIIYLFITIAILITTYFMGILSSIVINMGFIALQVVVMLYQYVGKNQTVRWELVFWLVLPIILSFTLYFMTKSQVSLQKSNSELRAALVERGAFDAQTNLRTMVAYVEDAGVFIETNRRFQIPVTTLIIKIRYFNDLRRMMSDRQLQSLLKLTSETIKDSTRGNDITYIIQNEDPTWAILLYSDAEGATIAANRVKDAFELNIKKNPELMSLAISMVVGIASWDPETMNNPYDLMNRGIDETQYDV
ncbi:GGDEF domain-containing protein [Pediococcus stilesii]|uniref:GGDEF domain protein n=1 Tax=Pediococcus stilesii TaxID=331679 RepID=A0A0R2KWK8_9LACO|nr:GGDEF domain-containing protein [Pediococcus stilesii]KRN93939.1 GGDEF domain protein [Pediococcus stilesii]TLQ05749.1 GGDEF domain-containing protein [Pediococcus stilesii]